ncbi:MAG: hypothetical protein AB3N16_15940 [Flavobacteriaceae bacterium]
MCRWVLLLLLAPLCSGYSQDNSALVNHYKAYYEQMKKQTDVQGLINALTHLNVLDPSKERQDTLAYLYANDNRHMQALNLTGIENNEKDSDLAVQVKALSLKALGQPRRAIEQFGILYQRNPNPYLAYELADLKIQVGDTSGATTLIDYGLANATDDMKYAFYERQQPYDVPIKAAFLHLKGLLKFNIDKSDYDGALALIEDALTVAPNFNLASLSKQALLERKSQPPSKN